MSIHLWRLRHCAGLVCNPSVPGGDGPFGGQGAGGYDVGFVVERGGGTDVPGDDVEDESFIIEEIFNAYCSCSLHLFFVYIIINTISRKSKEVGECFGGLLNLKKSFFI